VPLELRDPGVAAETCCVMKNGDIPIARMAATMPRVSVTPQRIEILLLSRHNVSVEPRAKALRLCESGAQCARTRTGC
jgi:hypothetical protein